LFLGCAEPRRRLHQLIETVSIRATSR
jgi:hypothetical protein